MPYQDAKRFVRASFGGAGCTDATAVRMFKEQTAPLGHDPRVDGYNVEFLGARPARQGEEY